MSDIKLCPYVECSRKTTCRTHNFEDCPIYLFGYLPFKQTIDEQNDFFRRKEEQELEHLIKFRGKVRGERF